MIARLAIGLAVLVAITVALIGGGTVWVFYTEPGTRWSIAEIATRTNVFQADGVRGTWVSSVRVANLTVPNVAAISGLHLKLDLGALARRHLEIESLHIEDLEYSPAPTGENTEPAPITAPLPITVQGASIDRLDLTSVVNEVIENVRLAGRWRGQRLTFDYLQMEAGGVFAEADGTLTLTAVPQMKVSVQWSSSSLLPDQAMAGRGQIEGDLDQLRIEHELREPVVVVTEGVVDLRGAAPSVDLRSRAERVEQNFEGRTAVFRDVNLAIVGGIDDYTVTWETEAALDDFPATLVSGSGRGDLNGLDLTSFEARMGQAVGRANGDIRWTPQVNWQLDIDFTDVDPGVWFTDWPGLAGGRLQTRGRMAGDGVHYELRDVNLSGVLRSQPVTLSGQMQGTGQTLQMDNVRFTFGKSSVAVTGSIGNESELRFDANVVDLNAFLGGEWEGALQASGRLMDGPSQRVLEVDLEGKDLRGPQFTMGKATATGRLAATGPASDLTVMVTDASVSGEPIPLLSVKTAGTLEQHQIAIDIEHRLAKFDASLTGAWDGDEWSGELLDSAVRLGDPLGDWRLASPARLRLDANAAQADKACWAAPSGRACFLATLQDDNVTGDVEIDGLDVALFGPYLPPGLSVRGKSSLAATVGGTVSQPTFEMSGDIPSLDVRYQLDEDDTVETVIEGIQMSGTASRTQFTGTLSIAEIGDGILDFRATMDRSVSAPQIDASLRASIPDTSLFNVLSTQVSGWSGRLEADMALRGDLSAPGVEGYVRLTDGALAIPQAGLSLRDVEIDGRPGAGSTLRLTATARSGGGTATADASLDFSDSNWPLSGQLRGENFTVMQLPTIDVAVSPELRLSGSRTAVEVTGRVLVPRAVVELQELPEQAVTTSRDVVVQDRVEQPVDTPPVTLTAKLDITLGEDVRFSGFGLRTELTGQMDLRLAPGRDPRGRGLISIESGRFEAYGQDLTIEEGGTLLFTGPLDDPTLDVRAVRPGSDVKVGVHLRGTGQAPEATVFSQPAMSEANALAYLLLGRPLSDASSAEGDTLKKSAVALGLKRAVPVTDQIGRAVGLDELGFDADEADTGAIMAGKQLTPDLYVRYSYGLFSRLGALLVRYRLSSKLGLEARTAEDQSLDLIYTRERQ